LWGHRWKGEHASTRNLRKKRAPTLFRRKIAKDSYFNENRVTLITSEEKHAVQRKKTGNARGMDQRKKAVASEKGGVL